MIESSTLPRPTGLRETHRPERRKSVRRLCRLEALSRPLDVADGICWGGTVQNISEGGLGLLLCYPFKPGTFLGINLCDKPGLGPLAIRVIHVRDEPDGTWFLGGAFVRPLSKDELAEVA
jgi:hypothetical protein